MIEEENRTGERKTIFRSEESFATRIGITSAVGIDFFHQFISCLAELLSADSVYVAEMPFQGNGYLQAIAVFRDGKVQADFSFVAEGTPCQEALRDGIAVCMGNFQDAYPGAKVLGPDLNSYLSVRLHGYKEQAIGVLSIGWRHKSPDLRFAQQNVETILGRVSAELQRLRTVALLEEQLNFTQEILDAIPIPVFYKDSQLRYMGCNREFEKAIGRSRQELIGKTVSEVAPNDYFGRYQDVDRQVLSSGELKSYEGPMVYDDGKNREVVFKKAPFRNSDAQRCGVVGTMFDVTELKKAERAIYRLANFDPATGLPNRNFFLSSLEKTLVHAKRGKRKLAILSLDLDHFVTIKNSLGQDACNQLIALYGDRITGQARDRDTYARTGSERFAIILSKVSTEQEVGIVARRILAALAEPANMEGQDVYCSGSLGIAMFPNDGENAAELLRKSETAMFRARKQGGNCYVHSSHELNRGVLERLAIEAGLRRSLADGSFELFYQPQFNLQTGELVGAEALLRWVHPRLGQISPGTFIPIAEECGLICPLGDWVLRTACAQNVAWQRAGYPPIPVAVNLSGYQLCHRDLDQQIEAILKETNLESKWLELELTESAMMENSERNIVILENLKSLGVNLSIDDFGTGYSSLSYLQKFPLDKLKIDQSFVKGLKQADCTAAITDAVIAMAHQLGLKVLAEGIETDAQKDQLIKGGCLLGQGYLFGKPVSGAEFEKHFKSRFTLRKAAEGQSF